MNNEMTDQLIKWAQFQLEIFSKSKLDENKYMIKLYCYVYDP